MCRCVRTSFPLPCVCVCLFLTKKNKKNKKIKGRIKIMKRGQAHNSIFNKNVQGSIFPRNYWIINKIENEKRLRIEIERLIWYLVCLVYYSSSIDTMRNREERWEDGAIMMRIECNLYLVFLEYKNVVFTPLIWMVNLIN